MFLSASQIRAARALLNWSQGDLAKATGLARPTIVSIETENQLPGAKTIEKLLNAFDKANIVFTNNDGVRKKKKYTKVYCGVDEAYEFFDFVLGYIKKKKSSLYVSNVDPDNYTRCLPGFYESHYVQTLSKMGGEFDARILAREGDNRKPVRAYAQYRWVPKDQFNASVPFYVFDKYLAIIMFLDEVTIFLIKDEKCADSYREKFLEQWDNAIKE